MKQPLVADIKRNSLDDGPGIRTTIFFKGCPLSCVWCHNPECIKAVPELIFRSERCIDCGTCQDVCPHGAIDSAGPAELDRRKCDLCAECATECPAKGLEIVGQRYEVQELVDKVLRDEVFFRNSGGGVTLSGGEPTLFGEFAGNVAKGVAERGVDVMIETCGDFDWDDFDTYLRPHLARVWIDLKIFDEDAHRQHCGRSNKRILANIARLAAEDSTNVLVRIPLIPELTATEANLCAIASFLTDLGLKEVGVMPYNPLWLNKSRGLGVEPSISRETWLTADERARFRAALGSKLQIVGDL